MADAVISLVVENIAPIIGGQIWNEFNLARGVKKELRDLSEKFENIKQVLEDAENRGVNEQIVKRWLKKLEKTAYDMDDILDEWSYFVHEQNMEASAVPELLLLLLKTLGCCFIPSSCSCINEVCIQHDTAKKIQNVKVTLDQILKDMEVFKFVFSPPKTNRGIRGPSCSLIDLKKVHGLDIQEKKDAIVEKLLLNVDNTQILSKVGTGGLGKTTLAKLIFNDPQFGDDWLKIWVCVSDPFVLTKVAKDIVQSVEKNTNPLDTNQPELILQKLRASVSGRKFLLVLDDVWTEEKTDWEPLEDSLQDGAPGSKILVTTRKEGVAKMMRIPEGDIYRPEKLSDEECWSLLRDLSFPGRREEECAELEDVGKKIAIKCKGLPLAAKVLGKLLMSKDLEGWKHVEESEIWQWENAEVDLFPHLVLSYNDLSPTLKRCFSHCAIFPKDHRICAESLIGQWMALGYLGSASGNGEMELKGRECLKILAMGSLFQDIEKSELGGQIEWCKMHDIVHDFAHFLRKNDGGEEVAELGRRNNHVFNPALVSQAQAYRSLFCDLEEVFDLFNCVTSVRVLRFERSRPTTLPWGMENLIHLRWLDCSSVGLSMDSLKIICRLYFLQTLLLAQCGLSEIPPEIGNLVQLRRLDLSRNGLLTELPESMYSLVELRSLSLRTCNLEEISGEIKNLIQLRRLDLSPNTGIKQLPESICSLGKLQFLNIAYTGINCFPVGFGELSNRCAVKWGRTFKVGNGCNKFGLLKKLCRHLNSYLHLEVYFSSTSELVELVEDARQAQLKTLLQKLDVLEISFEYTMNEEERSSSSSSSPPPSSAMWMKAVEALVPDHQLYKLIIRELPHLISSPLNFIKRISLCGLSEVSSLPTTGKLPFLESFAIWGVKQLKLVERDATYTAKCHKFRYLYIYNIKLLNPKRSGCYPFTHALISVEIPTLIMTSPFSFDTTVKIMFLEYKTEMHFSHSR